MEKYDQIFKNDDLEIAKYVINYYNKIAQDNEFENLIISRIKLQKSLYFLYALWFKYQKIILYGDENSNNDNLNKNYELFDTKFYAWKYGPVNTEIYEWHKNEANLFTAKEIELVFNDDLNSSQIEIIKNFIEFQLQSIFEIDDFILVNKSHSDNAWNYALKHTGPNSIMDNSLIYKQYN